MWCSISSASLSTSLRMWRPCPPHGFPERHAENRSPHTLRTPVSACPRRKRSSARGNYSPHAACGDGPISLTVSSARGTRVSRAARGKQVPACAPHALRTRNTGLRMPGKRGGNGPPHTENESPHAETILRTQNTDLRRSSAVGTRISGCTRNTSLRMRKRFSACGSTRHAEDNEKSAASASLSTSLRMRRPCTRNKGLPSGAQKTGLRMPSARGTPVSACPENEEETVLRMRKRVSARGTPISACTRNMSLCMRKRFSACGNDSPHAEARVIRKTVPFSASVVNCIR